MARREQISAATEIEAFRRELSAPQVIHVTTTIVPVERCDRPGWECPITGSREVRGLEVIPDLSTAIRPSAMSRINRWELDASGQAEFDALVSGAVDCYEVGDDGAAVIHVPIVFQCPSDHVDDLRNDTTQVIYWSGGWRSGKTYRMDQWWVRGWVKRGGEGEMFWLVGPDLIHAWKMATKIFSGRSTTAPLVPVRRGERSKWGHPISWLVDELPKSVYASNTFRWIDGSVVEMHHAKGEGGNLEGESVQRIAFDEIVRVNNEGPFNVCLGRVMQTGGQVGLASVPHDSETCVWVYRDIVSKFEQQRADGGDSEFLVKSVSGYDNPWIAPARVGRIEAAINDPTEIAQKVHGKWTLRSMFAYSDVWDEEKYTRDELSHEFGAWGLGPDVTTEVIRKCLKRKTGDAYIIGADCNENPQTRLVAKVFGNAGDWRTWTLVFLDEAVTNGDAEQSAKELRRRSGGRYRGAAVVIDANAFHSGHIYGGKASKTNDAFHFKKLGFVVTAPIRTATPGRPPTYSNPAIGDSRSVVRNRMRAGKIIINAGKCPRLINAIANAPNRAKRRSDKNTWLEKEVYSLEDSMRYVVWRVFGKHVFSMEKQLQDELREATTA